jgi:hypothetical protein
LDAFQTNVPIGGTLDFAKHFYNQTCGSMTIYDTLKVYKSGNLVKRFTYQWNLACGARLDVCFALSVPEKDQYICFDLTLCDGGSAWAGGDEYKFAKCFDFHVEPGHKSTVPCP